MISEAKPLSVAAQPFKPLPSIPAQGFPSVTEQENERLSVHAKPWVPGTGVYPESNPVDKSREIEVSDKIRMIKYMGKDLAAPVFIDIPLEEPIDTFETVRPKSHPGVKLQVYFYYSHIRTAKTYYGKISSRKADVTLKNIPADIPPLCVGRVIENIVNGIGKLIALHFSDLDGYHYDIWLDKAGSANQVVERLCNSLWTFPMSHGYAVFFPGGAEKKFVHEFIEGFYAQDFGTREVLPALLVSAKKN